ncbi:Crp/Fnr family transcriptional regulator [Granulosicoccus sp. 3-233]|uniref:Crp/Fnr family transcriptional regulator n=1 Tax=Granulosicoccus sp. 3-233 TaxID=3417969 RepID=UPI003D33B544
MPQVITRLSGIQRERALSQLKAADLFAGLEGHSLQAIVDRMSLVLLQDGEVLFSQGDAAPSVFLLSTGQIKLARRHPNGAEKIISLVTPGSTFAEAVIFARGRVYPVDAAAIGASTVWAVNGEHYCSELQQSTSACFSVLKRLTERLHEQVADIERLSLHTASSRLITYLLGQLPEGYDGDSAVVRLQAPKNVIASRLSIVPATFSRTLAKLSREGLLGVREYEIELLDVEAMRHYDEDTVV